MDLREEHQAAKLSASRAKLNLKLALSTLHSRSASILYSIENGLADDVSLGLATLRSEANDIWSSLEVLERAQERLGLIEKFLEEK